MCNISPHTQHTIDTLVSQARDDTPTAAVTDVPPPAKLDDAEENYRILAEWRAKIQEARDLWAKLDHEGAERALQLALEQASHFGQASGPVATSLLNLAQLYRRMGKLAEAEPLLERASVVLAQTAGPNNKVTLLAIIDLAATRLERGDAEAALDGFGDAMRRLETAEEHQTHGRAALREVRAGCLFRMASAHAARERHGEAEGCLRESLTLLEERWGTTSTRLLGPCVELARVLARQGRRGESEGFLARARALPELKEIHTAHLDNVARELAAAA
jgi:tetratricopeptide (TPR) repeat protein